MKKYVFYPILFSINPILLLLAANISDLPLSQLFPVILITPIIAGVAMWLLNKWLKDAHRSGFIIFLAIFWFFHYGTVHLWANAIHIGPISLGSHWIFFPLWTLIFILFSSSFIWRRITDSQTITMFLNIVCLILVSFSLVRITLDIAPRYRVQMNNTEMMQSLPEVNPISSLPDIYYIILDGYARNDVLSELYHYDNSEFIQALQKRGFYVAMQSQSNYMQTALSLASSLNMDYLSGLPSTTPDRGQLIGLITNSRVRAIFEQLGYKTVAFSTGYLPTDLENADIYFSSPHLRKPHDLDALLLINSAAILLIEQKWIDLPISRYKTEQERIDFTFNTLANDVPLVDEPKLVFAHIIAPHPPFIFDRSGPITPDNFYVLSDGDRFSGGAIIYMHDYINQLTYVNQQVIKTIDGILALSPKPPIIIIQGDHGPGAYLDWNSVENTCLKERFSILNAYYLPKGSKNIFPEDITPVNTFRLILNTYFGTILELLGNKEYFSTWDQPYDFFDVSDISQNACKIP